MRARKALLALLGAGILAGCLASPSVAAPQPAWSVQSLAAPTNFEPGDESGKASYQVFLANNGGKATDQSPITITDVLPAGIGVKSVVLRPPRASIQDLADKACKTETVDEVSTVSCEVTDALLPKAEPAKLYPGNALLLEINVMIPPSASGTLTNRVKVEGGGAEAVSVESTNQASAEDAGAGFEHFQAELTGPDGKAASAADSHPYQYTTSFAVNLVPGPEGATAEFLPAGGDLKEIEVALPPGLAGNPTVTPRCTPQQFNTINGVSSKFEGSTFPNECPNASAVGMAAVQQLEGIGYTVYKSPVYNLLPPRGMPAQFGFQVLGVPIYINTRVRSDSDYGITAYLHNVTEAQRVTASRIMIWGNPADPSHDPLRGLCALTSEGSCPANLDPARPFLRLPSSCENPLATSMSFETWAIPSAFARAEDSEAPPVGCEQPPFAPAIEAKPTTNVADSPSGLRFNLHLPQKEHEDPEGLGHADLKDIRVLLPAGLVVNPASAAGLGACSEAQIGYQGIKEGKPSFSAEPANCPDSSKIGTVAVNAPAIDHPLPGSVYLAKQGENPFNSLLAIYIAVYDPLSGLVVKLPGEVSLDPQTGQLTTTVKQSPQLPFEDFKLEFFEGAKAPLRTPAVCASYAIATAQTPWSAPAFGPDATPADSFAITQSPAGGDCPTSAGALANAPRFEAGMESPLAGAYAPFFLKLSREDGSQELKGLDLTLPPGLSARFAGVAECSEAALAGAQAKSGAQERLAPSCPPASRLGTVTVAAGAGPAPYRVAGSIYLAGPHQGAPLSMAIITPAVAGPFDLGTVVVRAPLHIDPETAQGTVKSSLPAILQGIPLDIRSIAVKIDRPDFTLNPTSCEAKALTAQAISTSGNVANLQNRFQVGGCTNLGFKPKLSLKLKGGTKRGDHPALTATLTYPKKGAYANIAKAQVALPHSEFLDTTHIKTICTRVQFAASACPKGAIYGFAKAITPLLDKPLEGPVYLRSSNNPLPDLVADLNGQIHVVLAGKVDSVNGGTRNTFQAVPDAPVSKFTLSLPAGKKGLLQNSTNICIGSHKATADFTAHNGKTIRLKPELVAKCGAKAKKKGKAHKGAKR